MNEIERAIEHITDNVRFLKTHPYVDDSLRAHELALEALKEKLARQENKPLTTADRIRGMSDEELARWLVDATVCERVCGEDEYCHGNECVNRVTDWLQQPAKE